MAAFWGGPGFDSPVSPLEFSEIGYLLLPSRDMTEIQLKRCKSSMQPTNQINRSIKTKWQHSKEFMCHLQNIAFRDYQESVTTRQTDRQTPDKMFAIYASQATQKHPEMLLANFHRTDINAIWIINHFICKHFYLIVVIYHECQAEFQHQV